jgi:nitroreductase
MPTHPADEILRTTRSVRRRLDLDRKISRELLEECIEIATQAPTGLPPESWRFLVITDAEKKAEVAKLYRDALGHLEAARGDAAKPAQRHLADNLHRMPALVLVCAQGRPAPDNVALQVAFYGSILPAAWSLMLALRSRGIGATWTTLHLVHADAAARILGIPADVTQTVLLPIGHTRDAVLRAADRRPAAEVTYWNTWGSAYDGG